MRRPALPALPALLVLVLLAACSDKPTATDPDVASVTVTPATTTVAVGATTTLAATPRDAAGDPVTGRPVTWTTSNAALATVSNGVVTGVAPGGPVTITATSDGRSGTAQITVTPPPVATVALTPAVASIEVGGTATLTAVTRDAGGTTLTGRAVTWSTGNAAIATVANGVVTAVAPGGPVTITASSEGKSGTAQITVTPVAVATIELSAAAATIPQTVTTTLTATLKDAGGTILTGRAVAWSTSNAAIATVTNGTVTGVAAGGPVTITATSEGKSATAQITVQAIVPATRGRVSAASFHACALADDNRAWCWGRNTEGQLGTGNNINRLSAAVVQNGIPRFTQISAGYNYTCALDANGKAWCWGLNDHGQLGNGTTTNSNVPVAVSGDRTFTRIDAGGYNTACASEASGALWCWGYNLNGTVGDNGSTDRSVPTAVSGGLLFTTFSVAEQTVCGVVAAGAMYCWGLGTGGALGNGTASGVLRVPTPSGTGFAFIELSGGQVNHCGRDADWVNWCWGINMNYGLGLGSGPTSTTQSAPSKLSGNIPWLTTPSPGDWHGCARTLFGVGYCWGSAGRTGDGASVNRISPVPVSGGLVFTEISSGFALTCGRTTAGEIWCWGANSAGQLGDLTTTDRTAPVKVQSFNMS